MTPRKTAGKAGEDRAAAWLTARGFEIIARNYRSPAGEVDIIALDGETIVFVEVKAWSTYHIDNLDRGIDARKQRRIIETAKYFLNAHRKYNNRTVRFDVVFINRDELIHFPSAFMENV
ncbi:MAG: YraN family protein [Spirochaetaceae bacterium]|nr:YraN family protein [Spirochaetaceae bacterium]